jgi:PAS domain S-box-containing protein
LCLDGRAVKRLDDVSITTRMASKAERNWPDHEVNEFFDQITAGGQDYRRLVERLPVIVYASELGEHGAWHYVSPQVEEILGYTAEEFKADSGLWARLLHPDDREQALENETEIYLGDRNKRPIEYRMHTRSGEIVWMLDEAVLEADDKGVPVWHGVLYDITERKRTEGELQRALAQQAVVAKLGERSR